jgi:hypothetical protein
MPTSLEKRVKKLESEVARLRRQLQSKYKDAPWWEQISGTFADDPIYEKAMQLGRKYRESTRPRRTKRGRNGHSRH